MAFLSCDEVTDPVTLSLQGLYMGIGYILSLLRHGLSSLGASILDWVLGCVGLGPQSHGTLQMYASWTSLWDNQGGTLFTLEYDVIMKIR